MASDKAVLMATIVMFITLVTYLGGLYGQAVIQGSYTPKWSLNPITVVKSFYELTKISTGFKFLGFFVLGLITAVIVMVIEIIRGV